MTSPGGRVSVALSAMRSDADVWNKASSDLEQPISTIGGLGLTAADISVWADEHGFGDTYEQSRVAMETMLQKAGDYFGQISANLDSAANQYERDDSNAANDLTKLDSEMRGN